MPQHLAHVRRNNDGSYAVHDLEEHLRSVGDRAAEFASAFDLLGHFINGHYPCWA